MKFSDFLSAVKDEFNSILSEGIDDSELDNEDLPSMHLSLNTPGFTQITEDETNKIAESLPAINPEIDEYEEENTYLFKRLNRDRCFFAYAESYKKLNALDPELAKTQKFRGVLVADAAQHAEQENKQITELLSPFLPAYVLKQDYQDNTHGFSVASSEALYALINNAMYATFGDYGYRDPEDTVQTVFTNLLLSYESDFCIILPKLNAVLHTGICGQLFVGATSEQDLKNILEILSSVGDFVDNTEETEGTDDY